MNISEEKLLFDGDTEYGHYQVVDMVYEGRPARILFSGNHTAAQSGLPRDDNPEPLYDYNKRFLELVQGLQPRRLLLIGGGAFTLPTTLMQASLTTQVDVVELDPGLKTIAEGFFGLQDNERLHIIHGDGRKYLETTTTTYDLILIDAFTHEVIPRALSTVQAITHMYQRLTPTGIVAMNVISTYSGHRAEVLRNHVASYEHVFESVQVFPADSSFSQWQLQNFIVTAQKTASDVASYLRFPALAPLPAGDAYFDD